ncbi:MAG: MBOAT family protein, partial [Bacteroidales bacterium]|nr:MBOAT family protein [Bacteroidales bacterium]
MNFSELIHGLLSYHKEAPLLFNSPEFLFLGIIVMAVYAAVYRNRLSRTLFLLAFSLFFYYKTSGLFVLLLVGTLTAVFFLTRAMCKTDGTRRKWWLAAIVALVLGILAYFKYANFLGENISLLMHLDFHRLDILLPVGISFYSFQLLSYAIDVYRRELDDERNFIDYAFYICFFPQLVAGPIVRAKDFLPQLKRPIVVKRCEVEKGFFLIMIGLVKKSIFADYLAQYNDLVFGNPMAYSGIEALIAIYSYAIQIYCDFSGYTDMAIGMGKIMGFNLGINFNKPYQSTSVSEFWHRWHISLS